MSSSAHHACGIAFGSNVGDRLSNMGVARTWLSERLGHSPGALFSPIYESMPVGCEPDAGAFLNAVAEIPFGGSPHELLAVCQDIEVELGRPSRRPRNAPRTIDLDVLYFGHQQLESPHLTLPHPRIAERRFVLEPLAAIRPELVLPGQRLPINKLFKNLVSDEPPLRIVAKDW